MRLVGRALNLWWRGRQRPCHVPSASGVRERGAEGPRRCGWRVRLRARGAHRESQAACTYRGEARGRHFDGEEGIVVARDESPAGAAVHPAWLASAGPRARQVGLGKRKCRRLIARVESCETRSTSPEWYRLATMRVADGCAAVTRRAAVGCYASPAHSAWNWATKSSMTWCRAWARLRPVSVFIRSFSLKSFSAK